MVFEKKKMDRVRTLVRAVEPLLACLLENARDQGYVDAVYNTKDCLARVPEVQSAQGCEKCKDGVGGGRVLVVNDQSVETIYEKTGMVGSMEIEIEKNTSSSSGGMGGAEEGILKKKKTEDRTDGFEQSKVRPMDGRGEGTLPAGDVAGKGSEKMEVQLGEGLGLGVSYGACCGDSFSCYHSYRGRSSTTILGPCVPRFPSPFHL